MLGGRGSVATSRALVWTPTEPHRARYAPDFCPPGRRLSAFDADGTERDSSIDRDNLPGDIFCLIRTEPRDCAAYVFGGLFATERHHLADAGLERRAGAIVATAYRGTQVFPDAGINQAGRDCVHADAVRSELKRKGAG